MASPNAPTTLRGASDVIEYLQQFENDTPPNVRSGFICYLLEVEKKSCADVAAKLTENGITVRSVKAVENKVRRLFAEYRKKKYASLSRAKNHSNMLSLLHEEFDYACEPSVALTVSSAASLSPQPQTSQPESADPELPLQLRGDCQKCTSYRKTFRESVQDLRRKMLDARRSCSDTRKEYQVRRVKFQFKRKAAQIQRKGAIIKRQKLNIASLTASVGRDEQSHQTLVERNSELERRVDELEKENRELKAENVSLKVEVCELKEMLNYREFQLTELDNGKENSPVKIKSRDRGGRYSVNVRKGVYKCLESQVPVESVGGVIESTVKAVTGKELDSTPCSSTAAQMTREMGVISNLQVAEAMLGSSSVNLAWDATTIKDKHVNQLHINTPTQSLTLNTEHLAGGRAVDYANHITQSFEDLAFLHSKFSGEEYEATLQQIHGKILSTLTDRAAANHATVDILQDRLNTNLLELNCQIHPLDGLANAARSLLKEEERKESKTSKAFGSDCCSANLLYLISKLRYKGKGDPAGFKAFLKSKGHKCGLFIRYVGNRLHVLFHLAGVVYTYKDLLLEYAESACSSKKMADALKADLRDETIVTQLQALGILGKLVTGPWMALFYTGMQDRNHLQMNVHLKACVKTLEVFAEQPDNVLTAETDVFGKPLVRDTVLRVLLQDFVNLPALLNIISKLASSFFNVLQRQLQRYLRGSLAEVTQELLNQSEAAPVHNIWAERALGTVDAQSRRAPNANPGFVDAKVKYKINKTSHWLESKPGPEQGKIIEFAKRFAVDGRRKEKKRQEEVQELLMARIRERGQKKEMADRNRTEKVVKANLESRSPLNLPDIDESIQAVANMHLVSRGQQLLGCTFKHVWNEEGGLITYHGHVRKIAPISRDVTVAYWKSTEEKEDAVDNKIKLSSLLTDLLLGDLIFD